MERYSEEGNIYQAAIIDGVNDSVDYQVKEGLYHGVIADVYTVDNTKKLGAPYGKYTLYSVRLAPTGQIVKNVPSVMLGGHYETFTFSACNKNLPNFRVIPNVSSPTDTIQNIEETPYVIDQPVMVGFFRNCEQNPVILGALPCIHGGAGQIDADYPKKYGSFQGSSWSIDKDGAVELNVPLTQSFILKVNGVALCHIKDGEVNLGGLSTDPLEPTVLGNTLETFLNSTLNSWLSLHTHTCAAAGSPSSTPINTPPPAASVVTSVVKVL